MQAWFKTSGFWVARQCRLGWGWPDANSLLTIRIGLVRRGVFCCATAASVWLAAVKEGI